jgi:hypothetical protein
MSAYRRPQPPGSLRVVVPALLSLAGCPSAPIVPSDGSDAAPDDAGSGAIDLIHFAEGPDGAAPAPCRGLQCGPLKFSTPVKHVLPLYLWDLLGVDLDGNGSADLAVRAAGKVRVFLNAGDGTFNKPITLAPDLPGLLSIGDMDGDGRPDLIGNGHRLMWNRGGGNFQGPVDLMSPLGSSGGYPADLNEDGRIDLVLSGCCKDVYVRLNQGGGKFGLTTFRPFPDTRPGFGSVGLAPAGDLDGDGHTDLFGRALGVVVGGAMFFVMFGDGKGGFDGPYTRFPAEGGTTADLDGDKRSDLVLQTGSGIEVALSRGPRADHGLRTSYPLAQDPTSIDTGDLNRDGRPDVLAIQDSASPGEGGMTILLNQGGGKLLPVQFLPVGVGVSATAIADFDGDGRMDIAVAHFLDDDRNGAVSIFFNRTP